MPCGCRSPHCAVTGRGFVTSLTTVAEAVAATGKYAVVSRGRDKPNRSRNGVRSFEVQRAV